jgi:predicted amidohydrolase/predicted N-acetyltransferase YhbS
MSRLKKATLRLKNVTRENFEEIIQLSIKVYGNNLAMSHEMLNGQFNQFSLGQFIAEMDGKIVGHCSTFIISKELAFKNHTYLEITGGGFAAKHEEDGDYLYGMEVVVDPDCRNLRIGQRLYNARKSLCKDLNLKGIVFGGRMPNFHKKIQLVKTPEEYVRQVMNNQIKDPVLGFQIRNGFNFIKILKNYLPFDKQSCGYAALMLWENSEVKSDKKFFGNTGIEVKKNLVRITTVQFQVRKFKSFEEFSNQLEYFIDIAADYKSDFVVFPEYVTLPLISLDDDKYSSTENIERLTKYTKRYVDFFQKMAIAYNINIIGGSHPTRDEDDKIQNVAYVFLRDGTVHMQSKIHITPSEKYWRNVNGGDKLSIIETDCGPIGVLICYDSEFPELARHLTDQGMRILFVPFCTDQKQGYNRVRYCCQARAIENQIYVAMSGTVGNLPDVSNMDVNYAESCILTPCDFPFARDGIAATTTPNTEMVAISDVNMAILNDSRKSGSVQNLKDRRLDLYRVVWQKKHKYS